MASNSQVRFENAALKAEVLKLQKQHLHALAAKHATRRLKMRILAALSSSGGAVLFYVNNNLQK